MKWIFMTLALLMLPFSLAAQETLCPFDLTATGSGYYTVFRITADGELHGVSRHASERRAVYSAVRAETLEPTDSVWYQHDYTVRVTCPEDWDSVVPDTVTPEPVDTVTVEPVDTATVEPVDTAVVDTIPTGEPGLEGGPNEPAGFVPVVGREFNSQATVNNEFGSGEYPWKIGGSEGWDDHERLEPLITIETDESSPLSPPGVMRFRYPAQTVADGTSFSPGQAQTRNFQNPRSGMGSPLALQEIYDRWTFKLGPNFQVNPNSGRTKIVFYRGFYDGNLVNGPYIKIGRATDGFFVDWDLQGTEDNARILEPTGDNRISADTWYEVEVLLRLNSAPGVRDGEVHTWIKEHPSGNRIKVFGYTDVLLRDVQDVNSNGYFSSVRHDPIFGGQGGTIGPGFSWYLGHHWVSGRE